MKVSTALYRWCGTRLEPAARLWIITVLCVAVSLMMGPHTYLQLSERTPWILTLVWITAKQPWYTSYALNLLLRYTELGIRVILHVVSRHAMHIIPPNIIVYMHAWMSLAITETALIPSTHVIPHIKLFSAFLRLSQSLRFTGRTQS